MAGKSWRMTLPAGEWESYKNLQQDFPSLADEGEYAQKFKRVLKQALLQVLEEELSLKQKRYLTRYYYQEESMTQIAREYGVNKSTVSRTIARGRKRLEERLEFLMKMR